MCTCVGAHAGRPFMFLVSGESHESSGPCLANGVLLIDPAMCHYVVPWEHSGGFPIHCKIRATHVMNTVCMENRHLRDVQCILAELTLSLFNTEVVVGRHPVVLLRLLASWG